MTTILETTDAPANTSTPYTIAVGDEFFGTLTRGTSDWVAITLTAGTTYSFGLVGIGAADSGVTDPLIGLRDSAGVSLASNDDGGPGKSSSVTFTVTASGTYYIEANALVTGPDGGYGLTVTEGDRPSYGVEMGAAELYRPGNSWAPHTPGTAATVTWGVRDSGPALDASGNPTAFIQVSDAQIAAGQVALANYAGICNLTFTQVNPGGTTNQATILMGGYDSTSDGAGAYAYFPGSTADDKNAGDLWINNDFVSTTNLPIGSYDQFVFLHELGHAMGLAHPGDYNTAPGVSITYDKNAQFVQDSQQYTVMSYFAATDTNANAPGTYPDTLMLYDIYALQQLYGVNATFNAGNTTYGFHVTVGGAYDFTVNTDPLMCIWDGSGVDTLDLSGFSARQLIDLTAGHFSNVGGFKGNLSIAIGAAIENAVGGSGMDEIDGNALRNHLSGGAGADTIVGLGGRDVIAGGAAVDVLAGGSGADRLNGGAASDGLDGNAGKDVMTGGKGADLFNFTAGTGSDQITDFHVMQDFIGLDAALWGGAVMTAAEVVASFAVSRAGQIVLDFGSDEIVLLGVTTTDGLAGQLLI